MAMLEGAGEVPPPPPPPPPPPVDLLLVGTTGNDSLVGGEGADTLIGVPAVDRKLGHGTLDQLTGGAGADLFVLGDSRGAFYNDGKANQAGMNHYARVMDFEDGIDLFQVASGSYSFREGLTRNGFTGTAIYLDTNGDGRWTNTDEMIALVAGATPGTLTYCDLIFV